jgi:hypothetical protein
VEDHMDYYLVRLVLGSKKSVPLSKERYASIREAKQGVLQCLYIEEKFDLVVENYLELEKALIDSVVRGMILRDRKKHRFDLERSLYNRRLINLLTTARTYTDQTTQHLKKIFTSEPDRAKVLAAEFSRQYDERIGYRVMEALRNFVQHRGLPVDYISHKRTWIREGESKKLQHSTRFFLDISDLSADGKFKKSVLTELEDIGEKVSLIPLVRDYMEGLSVAQNSIRNSVQPQAGMWESILTEAIESFSVEHGTPKVGLAAVCRDGGGRYSEKVYLTKKPVDYRIILERKNASLVNLRLRYATNEDEIL